MVRDHRDRKPAFFAKLFVLSLFYGSGGAKFSETLQRTEAFKVPALNNLLAEGSAESAAVHPRSLHHGVAGLNRPRHSGEWPLPVLGRLRSMAPTYNPAALRQLHLPAGLLVWDEDVRPIMFSAN
jgi:hypothetical protein